MFCHKCGKETVEDAAFCVYCGAKLLVHASEKSAVSEQSAVFEIDNINTTKSEAHTEKAEKEINPENAVDIDPLPVDKDKETEASEISPKKESKKAKEKKKSKRKDQSKNQSSIFIQASDERFKERNLIVYINKIGYHLHELNKTAFCIEFDAKIVALLDAEQNDERIKSEELIIPKGKAVNIEIILTEDETLVAEIISEEDYIGSKAEEEFVNGQRRSKIKKRIIILSTIFFYFTIILTYAFIMSNPMNYAKRSVEAKLLKEAQLYWGDEAKIENLDFTVAKKETFKNINKYDISIYTIDHLKEDGINPKKTKKVAYILSGTFEVNINGICTEETFSAVVVDFPKANRSVTAEYESSIFESKLKKVVENRLAIEMMFSTLNNRDISLVECTFSTIKEGGIYINNYYDYLVKGKVSVKDDFGLIHTAKYEAYINYDESKKNFKTDVVIGGFYLE